MSETINSSSSSTDKKKSIFEGTANSAVERMQKTPGSERVYRMTETAAKNLKDMMIEEMGNYNLDLLTEFKKVLKSEGLLD